MQKKLSAKEKKFRDEYLNDSKLNATQAAIRAGYAKTTADKRASMWVGKNRDKCPKGKLHVWDAVNAAKQARSERTKIDSDWLLTRLAEEANADIGDIYDKSGSLIPIHEWPEIWRKGLVTGVDVKQEHQYVDGNNVPDGLLVKVRLSDRIKRLELIGKHVSVQAFPTKVELSDPEGKNPFDKLAKALAEAAKS